VRAASLAAVLVVLALAGCGGSKTPSPDPPVHLTAFERHGKAIFIPTCGPCHELADAGTSGSAGPALAGSWSARRVRLVIAHGQGAMEPGLVTGRRAAAVAAYVAAATK
jgi:mono/diheme cytochrome c family protein